MCPYVPYVTRMLLVCYPYVLVWCFSHDRSGVVISLPKSNSLNETILFPTTTRIQIASILTELDENPDL